MLKYSNINWAWYSTCKLCMETGNKYTIERGSCVGQERTQLGNLAFVITDPWQRPFGVEHAGLAVSDDATVNKYFAEYLMSDTLKKNEQYTYGNRISNYISAIGDMLRDTPNTNQATLEVGRPEDILLPDPPCLRVLSWKIINGYLQLTSYWRSWDLFSGLPINLGGLQLLNELVAEWAECEPGGMFCVSDGAHVYDHNYNMLVLPPK